MDPVDPDSDPVHRLGTTILQWYYLVELGLDGHLLVAGGAGEMVDAPGLV